MIEFVKYNCIPKPLTRWRHYKTKTIYTVLDIVINTETSEYMVVYSDGNHKWARPIREVSKNETSNQSCWNDIVDNKLRFELVKENE